MGVTHVSISAYVADRFNLNVTITRKEKHHGSYYGSDYGSQH